MDEHQEVRLLFARQEDDAGETAWGVAMPRNSCDEAGLDFEIQDRTTFLIWAYGGSHSFGHHAARGQFTVNLLSSPPSHPDLSAYDPLDFLMLYTDVPAFFKRSFAAAGYNGPSLGLVSIATYLSVLKERFGRPILIAAFPKFFFSRWCATEGP